MLHQIQNELESKCLMSENLISETSTGRNFDVPFLNKPRTSENLPSQSGKDEKDKNICEKT